MEDPDEDTTLDMDDPRSSEETNWDQLQKIEDEESRDQDNVSDPTILSPILVLGSFSDGNVSYSQQQCYLPGWNRKTIYWLSIRRLSRFNTS
jgi:hypothetical protein